MTKTIDLLYRSVRERDRLCLKITLILREIVSFDNETLLNLPVASIPSIVSTIMALLLMQ